MTPEINVHVGVVAVVVVVVAVVKCGKMVTSINDIGQVERPYQDGPYYTTRSAVN